MKVEAGALYVPEDSDDGAQFFSYEITYSLLSEEEQRAQWPEGAGPCRVLQRAQLRARHWVITDARGAWTQHPPPAICLLSRLRSPHLSALHSVTCAEKRIKPKRLNDVSSLVVSLLLQVTWRKSGATP